MVENAKVDKFKGDIGDLQLILNLFFFLGVKMVVIIILRVGYGSWILYSIVRMQNGISSRAAYVLCYVGHLMSGLRPYFFTSGHISDLIGDIPAVKSSKLPCSMFFIAQTFTISQGE